MEATTILARGAIQGVHLGIQPPRLYRAASVRRLTSAIRRISFGSIDTLQRKNDIQTRITRNPHRQPKSGEGRIAVATTGRMMMVDSAGTFITKAKELKPDGARQR